MKITILSNSDSQGGAAIASLRLMQALREAGVEARMVVMHKTTESPYIDQVGPKWRANAAFVGERAEIFVHNQFSRDNLFKFSTAKWGLPISKHPWVREADVVVLGWINQGLASIKEINRIKAPLIWNMHDMWCLTGGCHHAENCEGYHQTCGNCPLLHRGIPYSHSGKHCCDLSWQTRANKEKLYARHNIEFVAVSNWLAEKCRRSSLMHNKSIRVIPNAFPLDEFYIEPRHDRKSLGLPAEGKLIAMGAARLDDPIKGLDIAIETLNQIADSGATAVFFGALRNPNALDGLKLPYVHLGNVTDPLKLREIYAHSSVVLSSSHYETLGLTLIEGMASGCVPVTFAQGGQTDIVDHFNTGYLALYPDPTDLAAGLRFALSGEISPNVLREAVECKFGAKTIANQYIRLAEKMVRERVKP